MSTTAIILSPKNLPSLLKRGTTTKEILKLVKKSPKEVMSRRDEAGQTLLHVAAAEGELELVQKLVEKFKANVEERDKNDWRPLHSAALSKNLQVMLFLLKAGASAGAVNAESATPLHYFGKIPPPASAAEEPLYQDVLTRLIHKGAFVNIQNKSGQTPLHKAVMERTERTLLINDLLSAKVDVLLTDANGETAAHIVARNGNREVFEKLLKVGGAPLLSAVSRQGETALLIARSSNNERLSHYISQFASLNGISESKLLPPLNGEGLSSNGDDSATSANSSSNLGPGNSKSGYLAEDPIDDTETLARKNGIRRLNILNLILAAEQQLVHTLKWLNTSLADPIKEHCSAFSISLVDLNTIFNSELSALYKKHRSILETLRTRVKEFRGDHSAFAVGDIFAELHAMRPHYKIFAAGAEESVLVCRRVLLNNPQFVAMVSKIAESSRNGPSRSSDLPGLLLSPLEHVCAYNGLLRDLNAVTPEGHTDKAHLDLAMEYAAQISFDILSIKKTAITKARILAIEESLEGFNEELYKPGREFVFEEAILVKSLSSKGKQLAMRCSVYLFNDLIMWARKAGSVTPATSGVSIASTPAPMLGALAGAATSFAVTSLSLNTSSNDVRHGKSLIYCNSMSLKYISTVTGTADPDVKHAFEVSCEKENLRFVFGCDSDESRLAWISRICSQVSRVSLYQMWNTQTSIKGPSKRVSHTATVVGSRLYVFGGQYQNHYFNDMFIYHLENREWTRVPPPVGGPESANAAPSPRCEHSAVAVNSRIFYFGGFDGQKRLKDLYVFDTTTLKWMRPTIQSKRVPGGRSGHKMVYLNNLLWLFGGIDSHGTYLNDIYTLNLVKWQWSSVPIAGKMPAPRAFHSMDVLKSRIAVFGGYSFSRCHDDVAVLDTKLKKWTIINGEDLRKIHSAANIANLGAGAAAAASKSSVTTGSSKLTSSGIIQSPSGTSLRDIALPPAAPGQGPLANQPDSVAPYGRYHHASFVIDDYVIIQGGLAQGTASFCDLWALTTVEEQVVWHPLHVALQLDHRFRHTISAFKNKTSGKMQAIMFGGISGLATSSVHQSDVIIFKDMELMVSALMKSYRRTVRKVAAISRQDLLVEVKSSIKRTPRVEAPANDDDDSTEEELENLQPFSQANFDPAVCQPETDFALLHALDSAQTMWVAKHVGTNSVLLITTLKKHRAIGLLSATELLSTSSSCHHIASFIGVVPCGEEVWLLQELSICSAASIVRTLGITLPETSLAIIARSALESVQQIHKSFQSPTGICPEFFTLSPQGHLKLAYHGVFDYVRDAPATPVSAKHKEKEKEKSVYIGKLWDAPEVYVAPEVLEHRAHSHSKPINGEKADIFSIGLTLLYLFTGQVPSSLLPSKGATASPSNLGSLLPSPGSGPGQMSSAFREFLIHALEFAPSKRPLAKTLLDHAFVSSTKGSKSDSQLVEYINLWRLYRNRGKRETHLRDAYDPTTAFKATEASHVKKKVMNAALDSSDIEPMESSTGSGIDNTEEPTDSIANGANGTRGVSFREKDDVLKPATLSFRRPSSESHHDALTSPKGSSTATGGKHSARGSQTRRERRLTRQNTYEDTSGVVVSRAYADDDAKPDEDEHMPMYNDVDDEGDDAETAEEEYDDGATASLSQLRILQEEYMEVQQSTAENQSKMATDLSELRMKLSIVQNELASTQAEFERRVEERVEREVAAVREAMSKEIEAKVSEQRDASEARFARQLEFAKYQLADEFKVLQRELYRYIGAQSTSPGNTGPVAGATTPATQTSAGSGAPQTGARRTAGAPLWKRPSGRAINGALLMRHPLHGQEYEDDGVTAKLSASSISSNPKSLSDPIVNYHERASSKPGLPTLKESSGESPASSPASSAASSGGNSASKKASTSKPASIFGPTVQQARTAASTAPLGNSSDLTSDAITPIAHTATVAPTANKRHSDPPAPATVKKTSTSSPQGSPTRTKPNSLSSHASSPKPLKRLSGSLVAGSSSVSRSSETVSASSASSPASPRHSIGSIQHSSSISDSSDGMSEAAREATVNAHVDVSKIWASHGKNNTRKSDPRPPPNM